MELFFSSRILPKIVCFEGLAMSEEKVHINGREAGFDPLEEGAAGQISKKLRDLYRSIEEEVIPERFLELLEQLDAAEEKANTHPKGDK